MTKKFLLFGSGELGKECVIAAKRLEQYVVAVDLNNNAPAPAGSWYSSFNHENENGADLAFIETLAVLNLYQKASTSKQYVYVTITN